MSLALLSRKPCFLAGCWVVSFLILGLCIHTSNATLTAAFSATKVSMPVHSSKPIPRHAQSTLSEFSCIYQVSGMYTRFQRLLYYLVMVFTFCFRFHEGLTTAGLAFIFTYSGTAAIHGFALAVQPSVGHDPDQLLLTSLMAISVYASTCFIMHSPRVFSYSTRPIFIFWVGMLLAANMTMVGSAMRFLRIFVDLFYGYCDHGDCNEYCSNFPSRALFRSHDVMVAWSAQIYSAKGSYSSEDSSDTFLTTAFLRALLVAIALNILLSTVHLNIQMPPRAARNHLVRSLTSKHVGLPEDHRVLRQVLARIILYVGYFWRIIRPLVWPLMFARILLHVFHPNDIFRKYRFQSRDRLQSVCRIRRCFATTVALSWYIWACLGYLAWPCYLLYIVIRYEIAATKLNLPEAESMDAVGQWSPWVTVGLTLVAAIIDTVRKKRTKSKLKPTTTPMVYFDTDPPPQWMCGWTQGWFYIQLVRRDGGDLKEWWKDPIEHSWSQLGEKTSTDGQDDEERCRGRRNFEWDEDLETLVEQYPSLSSCQSSSTLEGDQGSVYTRPLYVVPSHPENCRTIVNARDDLLTAEEYAECIAKSKARHASKPQDSQW